MSFFKALGASILKGVDTQIKKKQEDYFNIAQDISEDFEVAKSEAQKLLATTQIKEDALIDEAEFALNKSDKGRKILENASDDDKIVIAKNLIRERNDIGKTNFSYQKFNSAVFSKVFTPDNKYVSPAPARQKTETAMPKVPEFSQTAELLVGMKKPSFNRLLSEIDNPELRDAIQKVRAGKPLDSAESRSLGLKQAELTKDPKPEKGPTTSAAFTQRQAAEIILSRNPNIIVDPQTGNLKPKETAGKAVTDFNILKYITSLIAGKARYTDTQYEKIAQKVDDLFKIMSEKNITRLPENFARLGILNILDKLDELKESKPVVSATPATPPATTGSNAGSANSGSVNPNSVNPDDSRLLKNASRTLENQ